MLIDAVESRAADIQREASSLSGTITLAIDKYQGIAESLKARSIKFARREIAVTA